MKPVAKSRRVSGTQWNGLRIPAYIKMYQVQALLKLLATEAKKEVRSIAEAVETGVYSVIAAKDSSVNDLKRSAALLQQDKDDALAMIKRQKTNPANVSSSEKSFDFEKQRYARVLTSLTDPKYINLLPGDISHTGTDEATYADLLLQDASSEGDEKRMVHQILDARIKMKRSAFKTHAAADSEAVPPHCYAGTDGED